MIELLKLTVSLRGHILAKSKPENDDGSTPISEWLPAMNVKVISADENGTALTSGVKYSVKRIDITLSYPPCKTGSDGKPPSLGVELSNSSLPLPCDPEKISSTDELRTAVDHLLSGIG